MSRQTVGNEELVYAVRDQEVGRWRALGIQEGLSTKRGS
jgi:hypothetical protein